jgi:hypothetical protein
MLNDLLQSTKETLTERLSSPLLGSFAVAWCLVNYKFLVILFSAASVTQTFELIDTVAFPNSKAVWLNGVIRPLSLALAYVFVYPYPAQFIYGFTHRMRKETNRIRQQIEGETPLTLEESRDLRAEYIELDRRNQEMADRLNAEIARLKAELDQVRAPFKPILDNSERLYGITPSQVKLLRLLNEFGGVATESRLIDLSEAPKLKVEFDLGELHQRGLLERNYDPQEHQFAYSFTHDGRRVLLNRGQPEPEDVRREIENENAVGG